MQNVLNINFQQPYAKRLSIDPAKQKVFFIQNGIDYDSAGKCVDKRQVQHHYATAAANAQSDVDAALQAAKDAQAEVDEMMKETGTSKAAVKKATA